MRILASTLALLLSLNAYGNGWHKPADDPSLEQEQQQGQMQDQAQQQEQGQEQAQNQQQDVNTEVDVLNAVGVDAEVNVGDTNSSASANNSGNSLENSTSLNFEDVRQAPNVFAPPIYPTVSCFKGASGGFSVPGGGLSLGGGRIDPNCESREEIRLAHEMGLQDHALFRWCNLPNNVALFGSIEACLDYSGVILLTPEQCAAQNAERNDRIFQACQEK